MDTYRLIQWGTGGVATEALQFVLDSSDLQLVGVKCYIAEKNGQDAGRLAGRAPNGVPVLLDADELLRIDADCVLFMPRDAFLDPTIPGSPAAAWVDDIAQVLESGKNVVSPLQSAMHFRQLADGEALRSRLQAACERGGVSVFFTGLDPGFISDCLAMTLSSAAGRIEQVRTLEVIDYETYGAASTLESMGFGQLPESVSGTTDESLVPSWGCALWLVADALGVEIDDIVLEAETFAAPDDFTSPGGLHIAAGSVGALQWSITAMVGGQPRIVARHIGRIGSAMAPHWPQIGENGGYRVEIDGDPPLRAELPLGLPGGTGTCLGDAVRMTAARCVNAVAAVVTAPVGYHLLTAMPTMGARHTLVR
jgi:4-hydroxy-tetrahydrodipicolinate reductase